ncbi:hypothetical protein G6F32_016522 [Rhizopus arrhizus]|nr:hypothetical protein G6F32_016522 [Rhizopus arrhizus]
MLAATTQFFASSAMNSDPMRRLARSTNQPNALSATSDRPAKMIAGPSAMWRPPDISASTALTSAYSAAPIISVPLTPSTIGSRCQKPMVKRWLSRDCSASVLVDSAISRATSSDSQVMTTSIRP